MQYRKQLIVASIGLSMVVGLYLFGNTSIPRAKQNPQSGAAPTLTVQALLDKAEAALDKKQHEHLHHLLDDAEKAPNDSAKANAYYILTNFFETTVDNQELAAYYYAEKLKLENSQKNLTFAANFLLNGCINDGNIPNRNFRATIAKQLFEKALKTAPNDDSLKIGLGGALMHGAQSENIMAGPQTVLEVVRRDSTNAYAHKMLGLGNMQNGQMDKAIERFIKSYQNNPSDTYLVLDIAIFAKSAKMNTIANEWYTKAKALHQSNKAVWPNFDKEYQNIK
jgi:tetratricopeptide (TPR) repeat protein